MADSKITTIELMIINDEHRECELCNKKLVEGEIYIRLKEHNPEHICYDCSKTHLKFNLEKMKKMEIEIAKKTKYEIIQEDNKNVS